MVESFDFSSCSAQRANDFNDLWVNKGEKGAIIVWSLSSLVPMTELTESSFRKRVNCCCFSPSKTMLVAGCDDGFRIWSMNDFSLIRQVGMITSVDGICFNNNGNRIAVRNFCGTIFVYTVDPNDSTLSDLVVDVVSNCQVSVVAFSQDDRWLLTNKFCPQFSGGRREDLFAVDLFQPPPVATRSTRLPVVIDPKDAVYFRGHTQEITCLATAAVGDRCATGSKDGHVIMWDISVLLECAGASSAESIAPYSPLHQISCHHQASGEVQCICFNATGNLLASACDLGYVCISDVATASELCLFFVDCGLIGNLGFGLGSEHVGGEELVVGMSSLRKYRPVKNFMCLRVFNVDNVTAAFQKKAAEEAVGEDVYDEELGGIALHRAVYFGATSESDGLFRQVSAEIGRVSSFAFPVGTVHHPLTLLM